MTCEEEFGIHGTKGPRMTQQSLEFTNGSLGENKAEKFRIQSLGLGSFRWKQRFYKKLD